MILFINIVLLIFVDILQKLLVSCHWVDSTLIDLCNLFNMVHASQHPGRKSNPGLPRERRESYHLTTDDHRVMDAPSEVSLII